MNNKITVLIADDNSEYATELADYIKATPDMQVAAVAKDGDAGTFRTSCYHS